MADSDNVKVVEEEEEVEEEDDDVDGFSVFSPIGNTALTRAISGWDPVSAKTLSAESAKEKTPRTTKVWTEDVMPNLIDMVEKGESVVIQSDPSNNDLGKKIKDGDSTDKDITTYFSNLKMGGSGKSGEVKVGEGGKKKWKFKAFDSFEGRLKTKIEKRSSEDDGNERKGIKHVEYQFMKMRGKQELPESLLVLLETFRLDYYLIIGRPTMQPGAGLDGYREVTTTKERLFAPCVVVFDKPGMLDTFEDKTETGKYRYTWMEYPAGDSFVLDVSEMKDESDYLKVLTKSGRKSYRSKMRKFENEPNIEYEMSNFNGTDEEIDRVWLLYKATGDKNGCTVLTKDEFYDFHREVPNLMVSYVWDVSDKDNKKLVSFLTSFVWKDILHPMWCGTDYDNPLNRTCCVYFIILFKWVNYAIEHKDLNFVDLGPTQRKAKTSIGFKPSPCSFYFRCANAFTQMVIEYSLDKYYDPEKCMSDP